ncbi:MAG TPA: AsmA-like C-terminal region-containing protein [Candidatus Sulfotelmatobacter sp.]|nr:AsmA-like C-terminal region-containing protein [Candidatus Sulfotelmatobacter sp.]
MALAVAARIIIARAEPILRTRVTETLSARFHSRVELSELQVWVANGIHVDGKGLKIFGATDPNAFQAGVQPLLEIREFRFQTMLRGLFREPMHVDTIYVSGMTMNIPPKNDRAQIQNISGKKPKMSIAVDHLVCEDTKLLINTDKPGKAPLEFDIADLRMRDIGPNQPLQFDAKLINPKPTGDIHSVGQFGPLNDKTPKDSIVSGDYSFTNADLGTIKGIGGILSSTGKYDGTLGRIEVNGTTDTPDFRLTISGHAVPLHTDFHAIVDGTDGDTYLEPVKARLLNSSFTAKGKVVRVDNPHGHDIELEVMLNRARIEDLLKLGVKTDPPIMSGVVKMKASLSLPPGEPDISDRIKLKGRFDIPAAEFSSEKIQNKINALSLRSRGEPQFVKEASERDVTSDLEGIFNLQHGLLSFSLLHFKVPGTHADMTGQYSLDGKTFDFHGTLKLDAKLSQMTTGWKSILLKPVDPFFHKNGAGTQIPFKITGTKDEPHYGLDFGHKDDPKGDSNEASSAHKKSP